MKLTKMDMAKVIVTALYNLDELVTEKNHVAWRHAKNLTKLKKEYLQEDYKRAVNILDNRSKDNAIKIKGMEKNTLTVEIEYSIIVDDIVNQYPEDIIELWQKHNFHNGLADAQFPTYSLRKESDVYIKIVDDKKVIQTITLLAEETL